ncbi:hypothetical protein HanRHA438_Chr03g0104141 [Helianthus annuus]|uniref:Uncharacterized protein n=1 Tax=Helianthus annuus TaxID=4232 RepID=A0A9K3JEN2_HELAN|nr:hypothetical protein HanXRQr2_Chr03g0093041 [Helianthus annuus]KAJ0606786.1 hypothetical protein HanHA89_Chr03g0089091 [Helianthus annuus]KAJ0766846.1 hypothetical protein HanLR1_Chr03g0082271 [Helianthus annuus]KAJ0934146.1 hypothetical protein HanRHA438_Chr03g0104141 [Helianthus annuus]
MAHCKLGTFCINSLLQLMRIIDNSTIHTYRFISGISHHWSLPFGYGLKTMTN